MRTALVTAAEARALLAGREVYGVLEITPGQAVVRLDPAVNPSGTQVAQQVLTGVAQGAGLPVRVEAPAVSCGSAGWSPACCSCCSGAPGSGSCPR
ncbi:hypothetical protein AB0A63_15485 [Lentzea sp. NPDC042327]|uniref:hypothetical protein n=1 Tax=Lentzea sp. NPDC042327 TaxID=3154801 RepID=UPI0034092A0E